MAVYTEINEVQIAEFAARYDQGRVLSFKGIAEGIENSNYLVHLEGGPAILTLYERRVEAADVPFFLELMNYFAERGLRVPRVLAQSGGGLFGELAGRPAALFGFLEGVCLHAPEAGDCRAVGAMLAQMHELGALFGRSRPNRMGPAHWPGLLAACADKAEKFAPGLAAELRGELKIIASRWPEDLAAGVIHADLFPDNVLFDAGAPGFIDFTFACNDFLAYDLAICLNAWCFDAAGVLDAARAGSLLGGYVAGRALTEAERAALPVLCRGAALRFLLTRLLDWREAGEGLARCKDPHEYLTRLRFHAGERRLCEYGL